MTPCIAFKKTLITVPGYRYLAAVAHPRVYGVHVIDPAPFLSTIIATSAALVAIIGDLLVARFISLDNDLRTSSKILTAARERLEIARRRSKAAWGDILRWDADRFFGTTEIVEAVLDKGVTSPAELMRIAAWRHQPDELTPFITEVTAEAGRAREAITPRISSDDVFWGDFRRRRRDLPEIRWPDV
ncbi:MAG TPA: hypothetical protein VFQ68_16330 [Streptosporangiaceae bacterium]|nr:hypothetical protein [Streptosporangiaceae bacterium]